MSFERSPLEVTNDNTSVGQKFFNPIFLAHLVGFFFTEGYNATAILQGPTSTLVQNWQQQDLLANGAIQTIGQLKLNHL